MRLPVLALALGLAVSVSAEPEAYSRSVVARTLLRTGRTSSGAPLSFPAAGGEVAGLEVTIPSGASTGWHLHDRSGFAHVLSGTLEVRLADSTSHVYRAGDTFAEVVGTLHEGISVGPDDVRLIAFFLADSGKPVSRKPQP